MYRVGHVPKWLCRPYRVGHVPKRLCPETVMSRSGYVPKRLCPEVAMSRNGYVPKWLCPKTVMSRNVRRPQTRRPVRHDVSSCAGSARGGTATCRHQSKLMHHVSEIKGKMLPTFGNIIIDIISFKIHKINEGSQSLPVLVFLLLPLSH